MDLLLKNAERETLTKLQKQIMTDDIESDVRKPKARKNGKGIKTEIKENWYET
jgi:hypothetical protein